MNTLSKRIGAIAPSATLSLNTKAKELITQGHDVVNVTTGEPDWPSPQDVKDAGVRAIGDNFSYYTPVPGISELRDAVARYYNDSWNVSATSENVLISNGGKQILSMLFQVLLEPGDEVIIPAPYWTSYPEQVRLSGGKPVCVETDEAFIPRAETLAHHITERTKIILINSPSNPTGMVVPKSELVRILEIARARDITILSDEVYLELYYTDERPCSFASLEDTPFTNVIVASSVSKMSAMTGWRIGFVLANPEVVRALTTFQSHFSSGACSIAQRAAVEAFGKESLATTARMRDSLHKRRALTKELFSEIPSITFHEPHGAFYAWCSIAEDIGKRLKTGFAEELLEKHYVAVVPGTAFGAAYTNQFRMSFAVSEEVLEKGLRRIKKFVDSLL